MRKFPFFATLLLFVGVIFWALFNNDLPSFKQYESLDLPGKAEVLKSVIEGTAVIIAGLWAYESYTKNREGFTYYEIEHKIEHWDLKNEKFYIRIYVIVKNKGKVKLDLSNGLILIRRVKPLDEPIGTQIREATLSELRNGTSKGVFLESELRNIAWPGLGSSDWGLGRTKKLSLEPGQTKIFPFDFLVGTGIELIEVVSYLNNKKRMEDRLTEPPTSTLYSLIDRPKQT